jgi:hypothetical protein
LKNFVGQFFHSRTFLVFTALVIILLSGLLVTRLFITQNKLFTLRETQVQEAIKDLPNIVCESVDKCDLLAGDILIKRDLTNRTYLIAKLFGLYFTHSAIYLGSGEVLEARGYEKNSQDEILVSPWEESGWATKGNEIIVIRPVVDPYLIEEVVQKGREIASDHRYHFKLGPFGKEEYGLNCTELVWDLYSDAGYLDPYQEKYLTPDYLFSYARANPSKFTRMKLLQNN